MTVKGLRFFHDRQIFIFNPFQVIITSVYPLKKENLNLCFPDIFRGYRLGASILKGPVRQYFGVYVHCGFLGKNH